MAAAIKTARAATGRDLCLTCGYHGWLQTVQDRGVPKAMAELYPAVAYGDTDGLARFLEEHGERTACLCLAGSYTAMGPEDRWWAQARGLTQQHGVLLIYDEIVTGFRLALGGAQEYFGVIPDLAVFSKGIANGFSLAAVVGKREVMQALNEATVSSTFAGDTVGLAAAKACLEFYARHDVIGHCWRLGERLGAKLNEVFARTGFPAQVKGLPVVSRPYMIGSDAARNAELEQRFYVELYRRGISADGPLWYITWSHTDEDLAATVAAAEAAATVAMW
jgi:glutamate-1-semialdehyde aminotransferase